MNQRRNFIGQLILGSLGLSLPSFKSFKENLDNALKRRKVNLLLRNNLDMPTLIRGFAIDFDTLFNNLLINSLDSFKRRKDNHIRNVEISYKTDNRLLKIYFMDTGASILKE